jgi:hypothetical protein
MRSTPRAAARSCGVLGSSWASGFPLVVVVPGAPFPLVLVPPVVVPVVVVLSPLVRRQQFWLVSKKVC